MISYRFSFCCYLILFLFLTFPFWGQGQVVAPYRQFAELALPDTSGAHQIENHKFSDFGNRYIPEIKAHLNGPRSGWISLWTNLNEFGRPLSHLSGFSPAYLPSWILAIFTDNPWRFITVFSLGTCFLAGTFIFMFCKEIGLHPLASLVGGCSFATAPGFMYWLTFPMFLSVKCWSACALWGITRLTRKPDLLSWSILSFSIYSLLLTGYPQQVVFHAYILACYGIYLTYFKLTEGRTDTLLFIYLSTSAVSVGLLLTLPVYIDLAHTAAESARIATDPSFFTAILPKIDSFNKTLQFLTLSSMPELFGNPIEQSYPFPYNGISFTSLMIFFLVIGLITSFKKSWGWWLAIVLLCMLTFYLPLYELGIKYFAFNLSRSVPLGSALLPLVIVASYGADALFNRSTHKKILFSIFAATLIVSSLIIAGIIFGLIHGVDINKKIILTTGLLVILLTAQYKKNNPVLLLLSIIIILSTVSYPLMLHQTPSKIATSSPLTDTIRSNLLYGARFAKVTSGLSVLPANFNAQVDLSSVHSYNSLSSKNYHILINKLGGRMLTYGRYNRMISPDYGSKIFWMSNIGLILSRKKLIHKNLKYMGEEAGIHLYYVNSTMGESIQLPLFSVNITPETVTVASLAQAKGQPVKVLDTSDFLEFKVHSGKPSLLILSQKFHRDWQARVQTRSGWSPAKTIKVEEIFQGVLLPENVSKVQLEFKPFARFSWIGHLFWLCMIILLGLKEWQRKRSFS